MVNLSPTPGHRFAAGDQRQNDTLHFKTSNVLEAVCIVPDRVYPNLNDSNNTMKTKLNFLLHTAFSVVSSMLFAAGVAPSALAASFRGLGDLPGGSFSSAAYDISADGKVIVGSAASTNGTEAFRWTAATGMVGLGDLSGGTFSSFASAVSADGSVVVGHSRSSSGNEAFRWTQATGMVGLGDLPGGSFYSFASGVSADGQVVVGSGTSALSGTRDEAFRWTATNGMVALGDLPGGNYSSTAWAVSADGSVIVGSSGIANGNEAFRWTAATGMVGLGDLAGGGFNSIAYGISADGSTVVGYGSPDTSWTHEVFRWTAASGMVGLGFLPCDTWTIARAVSADGSIIVGDPQTSSYTCVFIWDAQHGLRELQSVLSSDYGLNLSGWQLGRATAITPDGNVIVGYGSNPAGNTEAWIANLKPPSLAISRAPNHVVLWWETNASGFVLEQTSSLSASSVWNVVSAPAVVLGDQYVVTNGVTQSPGFFRLRKP